MPSSTTGTAMVGINGGAEVLQEEEHDEEDEHDRLDQGLDHFLDGIRTNGVVS